MTSIDWNAQIWRLAQGQLSFDQALAILRPDDPNASQFAVLLARVATSEQAEALVDAVHASAEAAPAVQYGVGTELVVRGNWRPVVARTWIGSLIVEFMVAAALVDTPDRDDFHSAAAPQLRAVLDDPDTNPLSVLGAKHFIASLDDGLQREVLEWLVLEVPAEKAEGFYDDLLYEHGQVDPMVELARCLVTAGRIDEGLEYLEARHAEAPQMKNLPELLDVLVIHHALPPGHQEPWGARFARWAAATTTPEGVSLFQEWSRRSS